MCRGLDYLLSNIDEYGAAERVPNSRQHTLYVCLATRSQSGYD